MKGTKVNQPSTSNQGWVWRAKPKGLQPGLPPSTWREGIKPKGSGSALGWSSHVQKVWILQHP